MDKSIVADFTEVLQPLKNVKVVDEIQGHKISSVQQVVVVPNVHLEKMGKRALSKFGSMPCVVVKESWINDMHDGCGAGLDTVGNLHILTKEFLEKNLKVGTSTLVTSKRNFPDEIVDLDLDEHDHVQKKKERIQTKQVDEDEDDDLCSNRVTSERSRISE